MPGLSLGAEATQVLWPGGPTEPGCWCLLAIRLACRRGDAASTQRPWSVHQSSQLLSFVITLSTAVPKTQRTALHDEAVSDWLGASCLITREILLRGISPYAVASVSGV